MRPDFLSGGGAFMDRMVFPNLVSDGTIETNIVY